MFEKWSCFFRTKHPTSIGLHSWIPCNQPRPIVFLNKSMQSVQLNWHNAAMFWRSLVEKPLTLSLLHYFSWPVGAPDESLPSCTKKQPFQTSRQCSASKDWYRSTFERSNPQKLSSKVLHRRKQAMTSAIQHELRSLTRFWSRLHFRNRSELHRNHCGVRTLMQLRVSIHRILASITVAPGELASSAHSFFWYLFEGIPRLLLCKDCTCLRCNRVTRTFWCTIMAEVTLQKLVTYHFFCSALTWYGWLRLFCFAHVYKCVGKTWYFPVLAQIPERCLWVCCSRWTEFKYDHTTVIWMRVHVFVCSCFINRPPVDT